MKGGVCLPANGYIQVRAYESYAQIPLQDVAISVTASDGTALAMRLTDRNGKIVPIEVPAPDLAESQTPGSPEAPFTTVTLAAKRRGYEQITVDDVQVFADTVTLQTLEMIPISELPDRWNQAEIFQTPPQNL
jgi:hypothetical protein